MTLTGMGEAPSASLPQGRLRILARSRAGPPGATLGLVVACTGVVALVTPTVPRDAAGVFYLMGVLGVSSVYGLW